MPLYIVCSLQFTITFGYTLYKHSENCLIFFTEKRDRLVAISNYYISRYFKLLYYYMLHKHSFLNNENIKFPISVLKWTKVTCYHKLQTNVWTVIKNFFTEFLILQFRLCNTFILYAISCNID